MFKKLNRKTVEISLKFKAGSIGCADIIRQVLLNQGIKEQDIIESSKDGQVTISLFVPQKRKAKRIKEDIAALQFKNVRFIYRVLRSRDWLKKSRENFKPFKLTPSFDVVPYAWRRQYKPTKRSPVYIDTTGAFGSGLHETTRFMVEFIEFRKGRFDSFLDVGTGTGILSIVAFKCSARDVDALDIDDLAVEVAQKNLKVNGHRFSRIKQQDLKVFKKEKAYDFVAANLVTKTLVAFKRKICSLVKKGQYLAISGISREKLSFLRNEFKGLPLKCLKIKKGKDWAALLYKRL
ncbi:MAG: hypothetical protein A2Z88_04090 [Omnitrophica WOR_2 bacterium GWA2_47_8]|nr:MAG: hypothetical protein A2Z88_04090 [Omnitrophica WOR_2 bacterium GWA2_47_8]